MSDERGKTLLESPCVFCGYNGPGYWQSTSHSPKCPWFEIGGRYNRGIQLRDVIEKITFRLYSLED